jgi:hypothetical protein
LANGYPLAGEEALPDFIKDGSKPGGKYGVGYAIKRLTGQRWLRG